jgi:hypothetical protein
MAYQSWVYNGKPTIIIRDMARYYRVDAEKRAQKLAEWNHPVWWPLVAIGALLLGLVVLARRSFAAREQATARPMTTPAN